MTERRATSLGQQSEGDQPPSYERPVALRLGDLLASQGMCDPSASNVAVCSVDGNTAKICGEAGNGAVGSCEEPGNSATLCFIPGNTPS